ncbi:methylated-DNA--[protein]-cysteine S-methyltransferase [Halopseudomonas bauzanensis]|uniref:methylated-DNA--[protein]-cysteine S-methyltransferase n=1 Tax=Halopseudomonas bauzanensis TaxID=653930 RepID=UPI00255454EB|nr:methylated-DNA--[protein]-cysteine S-methyltransferase [Halopseudomonas bauzanensis]
MARFPDHIRYSIGQCELGSLLLAGCDTGICAILLGDDEQPLIADLQRRFPRAELTRDDAALGSDLQSLLRYVDNPVGPLQLQQPLTAFGSDFQQQVWSELAKVPAGQTVSYSELAKRLGKPAAVRAVAGACAANPLAILVPCHRVLRSDGGISGYRWGVERKQQLIELERQLASAG